MIVRCQSHETQECQSSGVSVTLASDGGWDVHAPDPGGQEIITHCKDWHRLERRLIQLGCRAITIQTGEVRN